MSKTKYKKGDVIHIIGKEKKKLKPMIDDLVGVQAALTHITSVYGRVTAALWDAVEKQYPEVWEKHYVSYHEFKLLIGEEKEDA